MVCVKVFLSYSHEDYNLAKEIKIGLELYGIKAFLAHKDIEPSNEWELEILKNLKNCNIIIPILTDNFRLSKWTDQEVGIAFSYTKKFIPIIFDLVPYGFMAKWQGFRFNKNDFHGSRNKEIREIINKIFVEFPKEMKQGVFNALDYIDSYKKANSIFSLLDKLQPFTKEEINIIINKSLDNNQITGGSISLDFLKKWLKEYNHEIEPTLKNKIEEARIYEIIKIPMAEPSLRKGLKDGL